MKYLLVLIVLILNTSCNRLCLDTYWRSEKYVLIAIDTKEQMSLVFDNPEGMARGLVEPTVVGLGFNSDYIVVKQHPVNKDWSGFDESITNYFVVKRTQSLKFADRIALVDGPYDDEEYNKISIELNLPLFSISYRDMWSFMGIHP